ncbi:hypothetical protein O9929_27740 [Vibrio lentus]|nr:hypothetical protein [Vibrio lentus]
MWLQKETANDAEVPMDYSWLILLRDVNIHLCFVSIDSLNDEYVTIVYKVVKARFIGSERLLKPGGKTQRFETPVPLM